MNQDHCTIQLHGSQEDIPKCSVSLAEWQHLKEDSYRAIAELKPIKLAVYKKELNLYNEKCRLKDEVISTLHACLDTYKLSNIKDNDLIMLLKAKITECRAKYDALRKTFDDQLADQKTIIVEQNDRIDKLVSEIQNKDALIAEMTEQHYRDMEKSKMEISSKYEEQITDLQISISERNMKIANNESAMKEYQDSIEQLEGTLDTERKGKDKENQSRVKLEASLRIREEQLKKQTDRLSQYFIKELHETLKAGNEGELKMTYLPHIGSMKIRAHHCLAGPEWIVIQRRTGNVVNFKQGWYSYVHGFGNLNGDFWYGLANIHDITKSQPHELYVHLVFPNNVVRYAYYDNFAISGQYCDYKLKTLGKFAGNAGDGLRTHKHEVFKSVRYSSQSVTQYNRWWQHANPNCNLNGDFENKTEFGVWWCKQKGQFLFLEAVQMLIRPKEIQKTK